MFIIFTLGFSYPQNNLSNNDKIYDFLDRMDVKGYISVNHHQKPFTRQFILKKLIEIGQKDSSRILNPIERSELQNFIDEYSLPSLTTKHQEPSTIDSPLVTNHQSLVTFLAFNSNNAFRNLEYYDGNFYVNAMFDGGFSYAYQKSGEYVLNYWNGAAAFGSVGENISYDLKFNDYSEKHSGIGTGRKFSPLPGYEFGAGRASTGTFNHDKTEGNFAVTWSWGNIALIKDNVEWGTGYNGYLIHSDKAPSYPHIRLNMSPAEWLDISYIHGDLNSGILDSSTFRRTESGRNHIQLVPKYYAAHIVTVNLWEDLRFSLGESVVYSDRFEPMYLVPVLLFRFADHYFTNRDATSGNAQMFSSLSYRIPSLKSRFDVSFFIDELSISNITGKYPEAVAFSAGVTRHDLLIDNLSAKFEYVRVNPFVYEHDDPAQSYGNRNYYMGHWIGSNADMMYLQFSYVYNEKIRFSNENTFVRKGDFFNDSEKRYRSGQTFLYGKNSRYLTFSLKGEYEFLNNWIAEVSAVVSNAWGENNQIRPSDYKYAEISFGSRYGFN